MILKVADTRTQKWLHICDKSIPFRVRKRPLSNFQQHLKNPKTKVNLFFKDFLVWHGIQRRNIVHVTIQMLVWSRIIAEILIMIHAVHGAFSMDHEKNEPSMVIVKLIAAPRLNYIYDDVSCCLTHIK